MKRIVLPNQPFFQWTEQMLQEGQNVELTVKGQSMRPFLRDGEMVTIVPVSDDSNLKKGTIILAKTEKDTVMMHRIFRMEGNRILMKGDGNILQTEWVQRGDVLGIAENVCRQGRDVSLYTPFRRLGAWCWRNQLLRRIGLKFYDWFHR